MAVNAAERDRVLDDAVRAGKLHASSRQAWSDSWDENPEGTRRLLDRLAPVPGLAGERGEDAAHEAAMGRLGGRERRAVRSTSPSAAEERGAAAAARRVTRREAARDMLVGRDRVEATSTPAPATPASSQVVVDEATGMATYRGVPVTASGGEPCVFTPAGWMTVAAFEASGMSDDDLTLALVMATSFNGQMAARYRAAPGGAPESGVRQTRDNA